jgi:hypothetical protein
MSRIDEWNASTRSEWYRGLWSISIGVASPLPP